MAPNGRRSVRSRRVARFQFETEIQPLKAMNPYTKMNASSTLGSRTHGAAANRLLPAADGREALDRLEAERAALVILDWLLPRVSGPRVLAAIRELAKALHDRTGNMPSLPGI